MVSLKVATRTDPAALKNSGDNQEYYLRYFGEPTDGQGHFQGSLGEHLFVNNAPQIRLLAQPRKGNLGEMLIDAKTPVEERVDRLFLTVLSRPPAAEERQRFVQHLSADAKMLPNLAEEAIWVLLSCAEFRFNR